jgi:hypothetical protein
MKAMFQPPDPFHMSHQIITKEDLPTTRRTSNEAVKGSSLVSISLLHLDATLNRTKSI